MFAINLFYVLQHDPEFDAEFGGETLTHINQWLVQTINVLLGTIVIIIVNKILVALTFDDMQARQILYALLDS